MNRPPRILVVGYNAWDVLVDVAALPAPDTKLEVPPILACGGGPGATAAVALARLGAEVRLLTVFGDDLASRAQRGELAAAGVETAGSPVVAGAESPRAVILVQPDSGERTILWSRGGLPTLDAGTAAAVADFAWDLLYVDGHEPEASLQLAAGAAGRPVVMDAGGVRAGSERLVAAASDVVSSAVFAPALTGRPDPVDALRGLQARGPARVGMTLGADGVVALADDRPFHVPAFAVDVRDTTGAGDAFHAGYAFARATGRAFDAALEYGCAVAALKCTGRGGRRGLPDGEAVSRLLRTGARRPASAAVAALLA